MNSLIFGNLFNLYQSSIGQNNQSLQSFLQIFFWPVQWTFNFLTVLGLLYLFHYQGMRQLTKEKEAAARKSNLSLGLPGSSTKIVSASYKSEDLRSDLSSLEGNISEISEIYDESMFVKFLADSISRPPLKKKTEELISVNL